MIRLSKGRTMDQNVFDISAQQLKDIQNALKKIGFGIGFLNISEFPNSTGVLCLK